jgi:hypothetical protein
MPPRRSARVAAVVERDSSALPPLPLAIVLAVFALLPVDARLRCREVCRGWRAVLQERSLWLRLDMSASGGLALPATEALLHAAASCAGGQLHSIDVAECPVITQEALLPVLTANAGALRVLRAWTAHGQPLTGFADARAASRCAATSRIRRRRCVRTRDGGAEPAAQRGRVCTAAGAQAFHGVRRANRSCRAVAGRGLGCASSLVELFLVDAPLGIPAALDAIVATTLANRFSVLTLVGCRLSAASSPALARLLGGGALRSLLIANGNAPLLDAAAATVLGDALRANRTLYTLALGFSALWRDAALAATLLGAVTAHRSLRQVSLFNNPVGDAQYAAGAALGALVAANAPALLILDPRACGLEEAALGPLFDALPANTHLRTLQLGEVTASAAFMRDRLLPAVRANTSLTGLAITVTGEGEGAAREAQEIVKSRAAR